MHSYTKLALTLLITTILCSCALLAEDLTEAKELVSKRHYHEAIEMLNTYSSSYSKKYNSKVHVEYGVYTLSQIEKPKQERYEKSKEIFEEALRLDSKNNKARNFYMAVLKSIQQEFPSNDA